MPIKILLPFLLSAVAGYLIGSVSFSIIITKLFMGTDVRKYGSGNAGATNVLRTAGKLPALLTFAGDFLKCILAVYVATLIFRLFPDFHIDPALIRFTGGFFCFIGHIFPVYFGFHGGKGVATAAALVLMISWPSFIICIVLFAIIMIITKIVSISAICAAVILPAAAFAVSAMTGQNVWLQTILTAVIAAIIILMHHANIGRLIQGREPKIGTKI